MYNFLSPELENLKKSLLSKTWFKSPYEELFKEQYQRLQTPITQPQINVVRSNIMGQTRAGIQEAQRALGARGFNAGESGLAANAISNILRQGQSAIGEALTNITTQQELANRQLTNQLLESMGQLASFSDRNAAEALQVSGALEESGIRNLMGLLNLLSELYGGERQAQLARYSPYWEALATIYGG